MKKVFKFIIPVVSFLFLMPIANLYFTHENDNRITNLYQNISPSVVQIDTMRGLGSGVFITRDTIVTNDHVVEDVEIDIKPSDLCKMTYKSIKGKRVIVTVQGKQFKGKVIFADPTHDIALVKINKPIGTPIMMANSDKMYTGDRVISIGSSLGMTSTLGVGYITSMHRTVDLAPFYDVIQTSTGILPGNSGGGLFNLSGELVGITYAGIQGSDVMGFVIPINLVKTVIYHKKDMGFFCRKKK